MNWPWWGDAPAEQTLREHWKIARRPARALDGKPPGCRLGGDEKAGDLADRSVTAAVMAQRPDQARRLVAWEPLLQVGIERAGRLPECTGHRR